MCGSFVVHPEIMDQTINSISCGYAKRATCDRLILVSVDVLVIQGDLHETGSVDH
jgi:hypothetical protein